MIAAPSLGDIVEKSRDVEHLRSGEVGDEARTQRIFMRVLGLGEAAQVANDHQDVLVDRVDMEQIVLHLTDDAAEHRQIASEDAVLIHAPQLVSHAARLAKDGHESGAVRGIAPECGVDPVAIAPQRAQHVRRHALEFRMHLQRDKAIQNRRRALAEQIVVAEVEQLVDRLKIVVDRLHRELRGEQASVQVLQQDDADLAHRFRRAVVALHELLGRAPMRRVHQAQLLRQRGLDVEYQTVLAPVGEIVKADAQIVDQPLMPGDLARFRGGHQAVRGKRAPRMSQSGSACDPDDRLQVAQATRTFLDVGLEVVRRILVAQMALLLLERLGFEKCAHVEPGRETAAKAVVERSGAG